MKSTFTSPSVNTPRQRLRDWYEQPLGYILRHTEQDLLEEILPNVFGYHILQIGSLGWQTNLLAASRINHHMVLDPDCTAADRQVSLYGRPDALPIAADSVDAVMLPHTLEFERAPQQVLREAERVLIPEGHMIILSFNPWSLWGLGRFAFRRKDAAPWCGHFISLSRLRDWLALLGFEIEASHGLFYRPPLQNRAVMRKLQFAESLGKQWWPFLGAVNVTVARKRVSTLTPIKPRWRPRRSLRAAGLVGPSARCDKNECRPYTARASDE